MTNEKEIEELLKPRYKVIADYPARVLGIGEVITTNNPKSVCVIEGGYYATNLDKYPHLFRKLEWWHERRIEQMPDYVKLISDHLEIINAGQIFWVKEKGELNDPNSLIENNASIFYCKLYGLDRKWKFNYSHFEPATREQYLTYNKTTNI